MSNWMNELEICWNKLKCNFFKIILILILKPKEQYLYNSTFLSCLKGIKVGHLSRDATQQSRQLCVMVDKWVTAPPTPQQLRYAAGGTSILVHSGRRVQPSFYCRLVFYKCSVVNALTSTCYGMCKTKVGKWELCLSEVNNRETIAAIEANHDTYCLQKRIEKFPLKFVMHLFEYFDLL